MRRPSRLWMVGSVVLVLAVASFWHQAEAQPSAALGGLEITADPVALAGKPVTLQLRAVGLPEDERVWVHLRFDQTRLPDFEAGTEAEAVEIPAEAFRLGRNRIWAEAQGRQASVEVRVIPGWMSLLPPLAAIGLALLFKEVIVALFAGLFLGAMVLTGGNPLAAFARSGDRYLVPSVADPDKAKILIFTLFLGGMVALLTRSGGSHGIVQRLAPYATSPRRGQVATWFMGLLVFFDDYANSLIVGSTMRPITDKLKVSREKLAYIVDSTAAPIASLIPISTWVGFEVGLIEDSFTGLGLAYNPFESFVASIVYRFYPLFALLLGLTIALSGRDFGPMLRAERRARRDGKVLGDGDRPMADYNQEVLEPPEGAPRRALNALLPVLVMIALTVIGLYRTGAAGLDRLQYDSSLAWIRAVFSNADALNALLWASMAGALTALLLPLMQRLLTLKQSMEALFEGFRSLILALSVLVLAWSIGAVCEDLQTADFVVGLTEGALAPQWVPALVFLAAALMSFAVGSSWGTMGILMPLVIPIAHGLATQAGFAAGSGEHRTLILGTLSSVLAGSVWGDHCSPISDTTILSSMGAASDHIAHVRTQLPYAMLAAGAGVVLGDLPTAYGLSPWISLLVGGAVVVGAVFLWGRKTDAEPRA